MFCIDWLMLCDCGCVMSVCMSVGVLFVGLGCWYCWCGVILYIV